jgi:hypothetical protein
MMLSCTENGNELNANCHTSSRTRVIAPIHFGDGHKCGVLKHHGIEPNAACILF